MRTRTLLVRSLIWAAAVAPAAGRSGAAASLRAEPSASELAIRVSKSGVLSGVAHNHRFVPQRWQAEVRFDPAAPSAIDVAVVVDASSLHDREPRLGEASRAEVDRKAAGTEVLDAHRFPEIRFRAVGGGDLKAVGTGAFEGVLRGELALHGARRPLEVRFRAHGEKEGYRATGSAVVVQSDFGMQPYSTAMGTIGVDDAVEVDFDLLLLPADESVPVRRPAIGPASRPGGSDPGDGGASRRAQSAPGPYTRSTG